MLQVVSMKYKEIKSIGQLFLFSFLCWNLVGCVTPMSISDVPPDRTSFEIPIGDQSKKKDPVEDSWFLQNDKIAVAEVGNPEFSEGMLWMLLPTDVAEHRLSNIDVIDGKIIKYVGVCGEKNRSTGRSCSYVDKEDRYIDVAENRYIAPSTLEGKSGYVAYQMENRVLGVSLYLDADTSSDKYAIDSITDLQKVRWKASDIPEKVTDNFSFSVDDSGRMHNIRMNGRNTERLVKLLETLSLKRVGVTSDSFDGLKGRGSGRIAVRSIYSLYPVDTGFPGKSVYQADELAPFKVDIEEHLRRTKLTLAEIESSVRQRQAEVAARQNEIARIKRENDNKKEKERLDRQRALDDARKKEQERIEWEKSPEGIAAREAENRRLATDPIAIEGRKIYSELIRGGIRCRHFAANIRGMAESQQPLYHRKQYVYAVYATAQDNGC